MFINLRTLGEYYSSLEKYLHTPSKGPDSTAKTKRINLSRYNLIAVAAVFLCGTATSSHAVEPNEICIYEHIDYVGQRACFRVESGMRHKLIPTLGNMNDRASSVVVGSGVVVMMYRDAHYSGKSRLYSGNKRVFEKGPEVSWPMRFDFGGMNDLVSSLIVVPRNTPLSGVYLLEGPDSFRKIAIFYPLPERKVDYMARYPKLDRMNMNDAAAKVVLVGDVSVDLYEHANFQGKRITLPSSAHSAKQKEFDLKPYHFEGIASSLVVRAKR